MFEEYLNWRISYGALDGIAEVLDGDPVWHYLEVHHAFPDIQRCCQTNRPTHQKPWERAVYDAMKERHSITAASQFSLKLVRLSQPLFAKK